MKARRGFTLVEMMTVIVIIGLLAFITMKLMVYVNQKTGKARAASEIERINHALAEFYAVYGLYPPTSGMSWRTIRDKPSAPPDTGYAVFDGLAQYLFNDPQRSKWEHFLQGLKDTGASNCTANASGYGMVVWTNITTTINDPWDRPYIYETSEPYQRYKLYSKGPDPSDNNTADDIGNKWME